jgi:hypothetical protein
MLPESTPRRQRENATEEAFQVAAEKNGWSVSKRGWPDFWMTKDGKLACIEVKPSASSRPKPLQATVLNFLAAHGIDCYLWNPVTGFKRIKPEADS